MLDYPCLIDEDYERKSDQADLNLYWFERHPYKGLICLLYLNKDTVFPDADKLFKLIAKQSLFIINILVKYMD